MKHLSLKMKILLPAGMLFALVLTMFATTPGALSSQATRLLDAARFFTLR